MRVFKNDEGVWFRLDSDFEVATLGLVLSMFRRKLGPAAICQEAIGQAKEPSSGKARAACDFAEYLEDALRSVEGMRSIEDQDGKVDYPGLLRESYRIFISTSVKFDEPPTSEQRLSTEVVFLAGIKACLATVRTLDREKADQAIDRRVAVLQQQLQQGDYDNGQ